MEDNIYNIKHISRPILPSIQKGQPAAAFFFGQLNVINHLLEHVRYNKLKKKQKTPREPNERLSTSPKASGNRLTL